MWACSSHYRGIFYEIIEQNEENLWIRRAISKHRYWFSQLYDPGKTGLLPALGHIECLDTDLFRAKDNASPYSFTLPLLWPSVMTYNQKLRWLLHCMETNTAVPLGWCTYSFTEVSLYAFLLDKEGNHLDPIPSIEALQSNALTFVRRLNDPAWVVRHEACEHNARVLEKFSLHLQALFRTLLHYTLHVLTQHTLK